MKKLYVAMLAVCLFSIGANLAAQKASKTPEYRAIDVSMYPEGDTPIIVRRRGATVSFVPLPIINSDGTITNQPTNPPLSPSLKEAVIKATAAVTDPKKDENAIGIALGYSAVSSLVSAGSLSIADSKVRIKQLTDKYLEKRNATEAWADWRKAVGAALTAESKAGRLKTEDQVAAAYETIAMSVTSKLRISKAQMRGRFLKVLRIFLAIAPEILKDGDFDIADLLGIIDKLLNQRQDQ